MVPSSSFVLHHEFLDVVLQPFSFEQKAEHHVEESSGMRDRRRACGTETEVGMLCFKKPTEPSQASSLDSDAFNILVNPQLDAISVSRSTRTLVRNRVQNPATSFQEWQKDDPRLWSTRTLVQSGVCERSGSIGKLVRGVENQLARTRFDFHNMHISDNRYLEKVFEDLRQKLCLRSYVLDEKTNVLIWGLFMSYLDNVFKNLRKQLNFLEKTPIIGIEVLKTNALIWGFIMLTTMKASVHIGPNYNENLVACRNTNFKELRTLFDITQRLILEHAFEILNVATILWRFTPWMRSTLCHDQVTRWAKAKVHVYSDSIRSCVGKNVSFFRSTHQVKRTDSVFPTIQRVRRIVWN